MDTVLDRKWCHSWSFESCWKENAIHAAKTDLNFTASHRNALLGSL